MKTFSKVISVALVLIMALSVMVMPTVAAPVNTAEVSFTVEQYNQMKNVPIVNDSNEIAPGDDIYALTVYIKNNYPIRNMIIPIYYDRTMFAPIDGSAPDGSFDWEFTLGTDGADYYAGRSVFVVPNGSELLDNGQYKKTLSLPGDRVSVTRRGAYGFGNEAPKTFVKYLDDQDPATAPTCDWWNHGGVDENQYGVINLTHNELKDFCTIQAWDKTTPYITILFKALDPANVNGAEFGCIKGGKPCQIVTEGNQLKFWFDGNSTDAKPAITVGTATVGETPVEKAPLTQLSRFWRQTPGATDNDVQLKVRSTITRAALADALKVEDAGLNDAIKANVKYVGFAMATKNTIYNEDLIAAAENAGKKVTGTKSGDILAGLNNWVVDDNTNIQFGAVVETSKTSLATPAYYTAFIILNDNTVIRYTNPVEISAADLKA